MCPQFRALATPWSWLLGRHPLTPSPLPGPPASPGLSLDPAGHRNGAPDSALYPLTPNQPLPCRAGISLIDPPPPPCLLGSEMHPSCPLYPLISFRKGFPFRTEHQLKPGPAPAASRAMSCGHAAGGNLCTWLPRAPPPVQGPRETASTSRSGATVMLHTPQHIARSGHLEQSALVGLDTVGWAPLRPKNKLSLSEGGRVCSIPSHRLVAHHHSLTSNCVCSNYSHRCGLA